MNTIIRYFDLASRRRRFEPTAQAESQGLHVLPQYVALVLGILIEPYFHHYQQTHHWEWHIVAFVGQAIFALIAGFIIFPAVYKNSFDEAKPLFVQMCPIFTSGVGWQALLATVMGA